MNYPLVDFRKPARVAEDIGQMLSQWQQSSREAIEIRLGRYVSSDLKVSLEYPEPVTGGELRQELGSALVYRVDVGAKAEPTLFVLDRPMALSIVMEMLGSTIEELPEDRSLTEIETTSADFLLQEIRACLEASQPMQAKQSLKFVGRTDLKELHTEFPVNMTNSNVGFRVTLPYGEGMLRWILPQSLTLDMVALIPKSLQSDGRSAEDLKKLVLSTPSQLSVRLGSADVRIAKLRSLSPGDVIVLNQRIDEPLVAQLGSHKMFSGWCGKSGKHQVFQIDEVFEAKSARAS